MFAEIFRRERIYPFRPVTFWWGARWMEKCWKKAPITIQRTMDVYWHFGTDKSVPYESPLKIPICWVKPICTLHFLKEKPTENSVGFMERVTRLELATSTLARWRSTGWATPARNMTHYTTKEWFVKSFIPWVSLNIQKNGVTEIADFIFGEMAYYTPKNYKKQHHNKAQLP